MLAPAALGAQYLQGGDLEGGTELAPGVPGEEGAVDLPSWTEDDDVFPSPVCNAKCGSGGATAGPRSGSQWAWFGGAFSSAQNQNLFQDVTFPANPAAVALSFYVWVGEFGNESAVLRAKLDGVTLFTLDASNQADFASGYKRVVVPLEDPVQGGPYLVFFEYENEDEGSVSSTINVDDVSVETTYLRDGSFEAAFAPNPAEPMYFDSPGWVESGDENFKSPICEVTACGTPGPGDVREPHGGVKWFYFGFPLNASVKQVATTPALSNAELSFFLLAFEFINPSAKLQVKVDGATRFTLDASNFGLFMDRYRELTLPLGPLAAGGHTVSIEYALPPGGSAGANVDDIALTGTIAPPPGPGAQPPVVPASPSALDTRITKLKLLTAKTKNGAPKLGAKLSFTGSGGSGKLSFRCKLDKAKKFKPCDSPKTYRSLKPGKHTFQVRAVDATGAVDSTPAKRSFQVASPARRGAR